MLRVYIATSIVCETSVIVQSWYYVMWDSYWSLNMIFKGSVCFSTHDATNCSEGNSLYSQQNMVHYQFWSMYV